MAKDSLSALLDGECSPGELDRFLEEFAQSPALKASWSRLCLARDASEGVRIGRDQRGICEGVMSRLEPRPAAAPSARVLPLRRSGTAARFRSWKPAVGLALAATVGAVALTLNLAERPQAPAGGLAAAPQLSSPVAVVPSQRRPRYLQTVSAGADELPRAVAEDDLRAYLIEHSNALADRGMGGTLSYARFAAHSSELAEPVPAAYSAAPGERP